MKTWMGVLIVVAVIVGPPLGVTVLGQSGGGSTVSISSVNIQTEPPGVEAVVVVSGSYTVATGYSLVGVTVNLMPTGGAAGEGGEFNGDPTQGGFGGGTSMPGGTYDIQAMLTVMDSTNTLYYYFSDAVTGVIVPPPS